MENETNKGEIKIGENKCVKNRLFHEWIISEWHFNSRTREGLMKYSHPAIQEVKKVICKFCLTNRDLTTKNK